ncbi:hypothetical protein AAHA92_09879 [Salvia divinorum]|uniref:Uncharacterized protein n=1 Tax=Salvia divinorum TaxID=28513 RepID=A0ABD1HSS0_SALDI
MKKRYYFSFPVKAKSRGSCSIIESNSLRKVKIKFCRAKTESEVDLCLRNHTLEPQGTKEKMTCFTYPMYQYILLEGEIAGSCFWSWRNYRGVDLTILPRNLPPILSMIDHANTFYMYTQSGGRWGRVGQPIPLPSSETCRKTSPNYPRPHDIRNSAL